MITKIIAVIILIGFLFGLCRAWQDDKLPSYKRKKR